MKIIQKLRVNIESWFQETGVCAAIYLGVFFFLYITAHFSGFVNYFPEESNLLGWDADFYLEIKDLGYSYFWYMGSNSGFFPAFPYLWRWLNVGVTGICLVNFALLIASLSILRRAFSLGRTEILMYLSLPTGIFFLLPFSESLFFLCGAILLCGLQMQRTGWVIAGLFLASLCRPTTLFFAPAIIGMEVLFHGEVFSRAVVKRILMFLLASLAGLLVVVLVQYAQTYEWFAFAKVQTRFYRHTFSLPSFPLSSFNGDPILWLDALAMFFGVLAAVIVCIYLVRFFAGRSDTMYTNRPFWFSAIFLFCTVLYTLFFNPKNFVGETQINSVSRYVLCTPYFFMFFAAGLKQFDLDKRNLAIFLATALLVWIALGLGRPLPFLARYQSEHRTSLFFLFITVYATLFVLIKHKRFRPYVATFQFLLGMLLSVWLLNWFLMGRWVA